VINAAIKPMFGGRRGRSDYVETIVADWSQPLTTTNRNVRPSIVVRCRGVRQASPSHVLAHTVTDNVVGRAINVTRTVKKSTTDGRTFRVVSRVQENRSSATAEMADRCSKSRSELNCK